MKYIMLETKEATRRVIPVIFPTSLVHKTVAKHFIRAMREHGTDVTVYSAGEPDIKVNNCGGFSGTLNITPSNDDAEIINAYDYSDGLAPETVEPVPASSTCQTRTKRVEQPSVARSRQGAGRASPVHQSALAVLLSVMHDRLNHRASKRA